MVAVISSILVLHFVNYMVIVAQLVEPRIVIPVVVGSSPISHPSLFLIRSRVLELSRRRLTLQLVSLMAPFPIVD